MFIIIPFSCSNEYSLPDSSSFGRLTGATDMIGRLLNLLHGVYPSPGPDRNTTVIKISILLSASLNDPCLRKLRTNVRRIDATQVWNRIVGDLCTVLIGSLQRLHEVRSPAKIFFRSHKTGFPVAARTLFVGHVDQRDGLSLSITPLAVLLPAQSHIEGISIDDSNQQFSLRDALGASK